MQSLGQKKITTGFTLIEVVVAVAIFGVISSIAFPALVQFLDAREHILERNHRITDVQKLFLFLERDLRFASNRLGKDEFGDSLDSALTVNDESLLELTALYPDMRLTGSSVPRRVKWSLQDQQLIRTQYPVMDPDGETRSSRRVFLDDVESVDISVRYIEEGRDSQTDRWIESERLPEFLEFSVRVADDIIYTRQVMLPSGNHSE